jgi:hypothetical protein
METKMKSVFYCMIILACMATQAAAQIRYVDIAPDTILAATLASPWANYELDLDGDGNSDFVVTQFHPDPTLHIAEMSATQYGRGDVLVDANNVPRCLARNAPIDAAQLVWHDAGTNALHMSDNWRGAKDGYLGLRILKGNRYYYAWVRLDVADDESTITVKDLACGMTADSGITAGTGSPTATDNFVVRDPLTYRLAGHALIIELPAQSQTWEIFILDPAGRTHAKRTVDHPFCIIDLAGLSRGEYFFVVLAREAATFRKFILK